MTDDTMPEEAGRAGDGRLFARHGITDGRCVLSANFARGGAPIRRNFARRVPFDPCTDGATRVLRNGRRSVSRVTGHSRGKASLDAKDSAVG